MARNRVSPKTKQNFQNRIRNVVKGLSRKVAIYLQPAKSECSNCYYDKLTDKSTGKCRWTPVQAIEQQALWVSSGGLGDRYKYFLRGRCPICRGKGFLETVRKNWVDCLVTWDPSSNGASNDMTYTPAGTEGSTIVQLKTDPKFFNVFRNCQKIVVDGIECKLSKPPILRGLGNQALLIVMAFTTEKPSIDSGEIIKDYT